MSSVLIDAAIQEHLGDNAKDLLTLAYQSMDVWNDVTVLPNIKNKTRLTALKIDKLVQPFKNTFSPKEDAISFVPREVGVDTAMADLEIFPEDYRQTYLAEFTKPGIAKSPEDIPFAQHVWEAVFAEFGEELNNDTAYFGVRDAAGTDAVDVTDGYKKHIATMITDGAVTPNAIGALASNTAYDQLHTLYRSIPEKYRKRGWKLTAYMSQSNYDKYTDNLDVKNWNTGRGDDYIGPKFLRKSDAILELKPVTWMAGSNRVFITPRLNILLLADATMADLAMMEVIKKIGGFDARIACAIGFNFRYAGLIWCNEVV